MQTSRHREATDIRLVPSDSLYFRVLGKIMRSQNKLGDFEKSGKLVMKQVFMSVSKKWPTSPALHPNYSLKSRAKAQMLYESLEHCAATERSTGNPSRIWLDSVKN